ncbi:MAG: hypothetical protein CMP23_04080 [Rickettsiales bacterium]|nr:hypothetical protein [Rickettsiales bacterium]
MSLLQRIVLFVLLGLGLVPLTGCESHRSECEDICRSFVNTCEWNAWTHVSQCTQGCVEDMYRRHDVDEVFACYRRAVAAPAREEARQVVERALDAGLFSKSQEIGEFDLEAEVDRAVEAGTCDPFAAVQCKVQALKTEPAGLLITK